MRRLLVAIALILYAFPALAQDKAEEEKSYFLQYVEQKLSTPNRKISISGISGVLSEIDASKFTRDSLCLMGKGHCAPGLSHG